MRPHDIPHVARHLLEKHGLYQQGWRFEWDNAKRRAGQCRYRSKTISLSRHYVGLNVTDRLDEIIDTILHEIAHALVGPGHGHDAVWKAKCIEIGAKPERCYDNAVDMPKGKYAAKCGGCGKEFSRHKPMKRGRWVYCAACGPDLGRLEYKRVEQTVVNTKPVQDTPPKPKKLR